MSTTLATTQFCGVKNAVSRGLPHMKLYLRLTFLQGPKELLTSRISVKCAAIVVAMCSPSLLFCAMLTIPEMVFQSPYQNAYFQFAKVLERDPTRWIVLVLVGICTLTSLAIPATMPKPRETGLY